MKKGDKIKIVAGLPEDYNDNFNGQSGVILDIDKEVRKLKYEVRLESGNCIYFRKKSLQLNQ